MTEDDKKAPEAETPEAEMDAAETGADVGEEAVPEEETSTEDQPGTEEGSGEESVDAEALQAEVADLKDRLLRAVAETENVRRRAQREKEDASKYAIAGFAREMLVVADNLRRALDSVDADARAASEALENMAVGVEMTERAMLNAFEQVGIRPIDADGKPFDHNYHEAMFEVEIPDQPAGQVVQVMEQGYVLGDRLLRPARVGVSKGGPKADTPPASNPASNPAEPQGDGSAYEADAASKGTSIDEEL